MPFFVPPKERTSTPASHVSFRGATFSEAPTAPESLQEAGLTLGFLSDQVLKILYTRGVMLGLGATFVTVMLAALATNCVSGTLA